jgi:hypothetical protein
MHENQLPVISLPLPHPSSSPFLDLPHPQNELVQLKKIVGRIPTDLIKNFPTTFNELMPH